MNICRLVSSLFLLPNPYTIRCHWPIELFLSSINFLFNNERRRRFLKFRLWPLCLWSKDSIAGSQPILTCKMNISWCSLLNNIIKYLLRCFGSFAILTTSFSLLIDSKLFGCRLHYMKNIFVYYFYFVHLVLIELSSLNYYIHYIIFW